MAEEYMSDDTTKMCKICGEENQVNNVKCSLCSNSFSGNNQKKELIDTSIKNIIQSAKDLYGIDINNDYYKDMEDYKALSEDKKMLVNSWGYRLEDARKELNSISLQNAGSTIKKIYKSPNSKKSPKKSPKKRSITTKKIKNEKKYGHKKL